MKDDFAIVSTTFRDAQDGERIIAALFDHGLAACVQTMPIISHFRWNGEMNCEGETLMLIKTRAHLFAQVTELIRSAHTYDVPEILLLPVTDGLPAYLRWIADETRAGVTTVRESP